jgi:DNA-binding transcriptional LysR family regulator
MSSPTLDPELLKAFLAVADQLSFTRAASSLNRTQSTVSSQIKRLESRLKTELFNRSTTKVELSPAGEALVGYARRILMVGEEAVQRLKQHRIDGSVRLGVMDDYGTLLLPPILRDFANLYPSIELQMETGLTSGMVGRVGSLYDIVIAMHAAGERTGEFLRREQAVWAGVASFNPNELDPLPVALYPTGCLFRKWALDALDHAGRRWRLAFVSHSLAAVEAIANQGLAITVVKSGTLPRSLTTFGREHGLPPLPLADIRLHCAPSLSPASDLLAHHIRKHLGSRIHGFG